MYTQGWRLAATVFALVCDDALSQLQHSSNSLEWLTSAHHRQSATLYASTGRLADSGCICACLCSARASANGVSACWGKWACARCVEESVQAMSTCHPLARHVRGALAAGISALAQLQILAAMRGEGV
jgi:hypothetical protein